MTQRWGEEETDNPIYPQRSHGAAAINRLKPKLAGSKTGPIIEL